MSGIAFAGDVKVSVFILREPLQPVYQEDIVIFRSFSITEVIVIGCSVGVRKSNARRRLQKQDICGLVPSVRVSV